MKKERKREQYNIRIPEEKKINKKFKKKALLITGCISTIECWF